MIKSLGKNGNNSKPNKHMEKNSPNMVVLIEHDIYGHTLLLLPQEYVHTSLVYVNTKQNELLSVTLLMHFLNNWHPFNS